VQLRKYGDEQWTCDKVILLVMDLYTPLFKVSVDGEVFIFKGQAIEEEPVASYKLFNLFKGVIDRSNIRQSALA